MGWANEGGRIAFLWLLGFVAANAALGGWNRFRARADREAVHRVGSRDIGPVEAAFYADLWKYAARTAAYILVLKRAVDVSDQGVLTVVRGARNPADPVLAALLDAIRERGTKGARVYEFLDEEDFAEYRDRLYDRTPGLRWHGPNRLVVVISGLVLSLGMAVHGLWAQAPIPPRDGGFGWWILLWIPVWGVFALSALAWPKAHSRRWRRFNRECQQRVDRVLDGLPDKVRAKVDRGTVRPSPPRRPARSWGSSSGSGSSYSGGSSWSGDSSSSCGSGSSCGGGGD
ncbi:hypothetical protein [Streptomyces qinzhouensis]|uniref:TIGR04222 domain-containing membrane protein n=1 Tax=Streptomyces qinzhouensis TaxID=2599401 RepID=A0A5B8JE75_9ACTN|nr:hypothetical protein [Streptomyces qinzhouensis]QDY79887.1 hypothetical protein FQU76_28865 [Streptomyces qinzhouensis]